MKMTAIFTVWQVLILLNLLYFGSSVCPQSCSQCNTSGCTLCSLNNFVVLATPISLGCLPCPASCKSCTSQSDQIKCTQCAPQYYRQSATNQCKSCQANNCLECEQYSPYLCTTCKDNYYLIQSVGVCSPCTDYSNALSCRQNVILGCMPGYFTTNGAECLACRANCLTCSNFDICTKCLTGYFGNNCTACNKNCLQCTSLNVCSSCPPNFFLNISSMCQLCNGYPKCLECNLNNQCIKCQVGYYVNINQNYQCTSISSALLVPKCLNYRAPGICSECSSMFFPTKTNTSNIDICIPCSILCTKCNGHYRSSSCTSCSIQAYQVQSGVCAPLTTSPTVANAKQIYKSWRVNNILMWGNQQIAGSISSSSIYGCQRVTLSQSVGWDLKAISGYQFTIKLKILIKPSISPETITVLFNSIFLKNITLSTNTFSDCDGVYSGIESFSFNNLNNLVTLSSNIIKLFPSAQNSLISISQLLITYKQCHQSCSLCLSYMQCVYCNESSLPYLENQKCVSTCSQLLSLDNISKSCVKQCPRGTYSDVTQWKCAFCPQGCVSCLNKQKCISCKNGYFLNLSKCVTTCPPKYFPNNKTHICQPCWYPCLQCLNQTYCKSCSVNFLENFTCKSICSPQFYKNFNNMSCSACISPCITCTTSLQCTSCISNYSLSPYLSGETCIVQCPLRYTSVLVNTTGAKGQIISHKVCQQCQFPCYSCLNNTKFCLSCQNGFLLNGSCVNKCSVGTYERVTNMSCLKCLAPCNQCYSQGTKCRTCINGYVLADSYCYKNCPDGFFLNNITSKCQLCPSKCSSCSSLQKCSSCNPPYSLFSNQCIYECPFGYYQNVSTLVCDPCNQTCETCLYVSTYCLTCGIGFKLTSKHQCINKCQLTELSTTCQPCQFPCRYCQVTIRNCTKCEPSYYLIESQGICSKQCNEGFYINQTARLCSQCQQGCKRCNTLEHCQQCQQNYYLLNQLQGIFAKCLSLCPSRFYINQQFNLCEKCFQPCKQCINQTACLSCTNGLYDLQQKKCYTSFQCPVGKYRNNLTCQSCNTSCLACTAATICTVCAQNFYLRGNLCVKFCGTQLIPVLSVRACKPCSYPCQTCINDVNNCTKCSQPIGFTKYFLWKNTCLIACPANAYASSQYCFGCNKPCLTCSSLNICTSCLENYYFLQGKCYQTCPQTYYGNKQIPYTCLACSYPCNTCISLTECLTCQSGLQLGMTCLVGSDCPIGYFRKLDSNRQFCEACDHICELCYLQASFCLKCSDSRFSSLNGQCFLNCPTGYFSSNSTIAYPGLIDKNMKVCNKCPNGCQVCINSNNCTLCSTNNFLLNGICLKQCPSSYFPNNKSCQECQTPCLECINSNDTCTKCSLNSINNQTSLLLWNWKCFQECPEGTFLESTNQCRSCPFPCNTCSSYDKCDSCLRGYLLEGNVCRTECFQGYMNQKWDKCIPKCPDNEYLIYDSNQKAPGRQYWCTSICTYPFVKDIQKFTCSRNCRQQQYIDQNYQCQKLSSLKKTIPSFKAILYQNSKSDLMVWVAFNQQMLLDTQLSPSSNLQNIISITHENRFSLAIGRLLQSNSSQLVITSKVQMFDGKNILLKLKTSLDINKFSSQINIVFKNNRNLLLKDKINYLPIQNNRTTVQITTNYRNYSQLLTLNVRSFALIGQVLIDFTFILAIILIMFNKYSKIYHFLLYCQVLFALSLVQIQFPPNLWQFLQGFKWVNLFQLGNWFTGRVFGQPATPIQPYQQAPSKILALFGTTNFIAIVGHTILIYIIFVVIALCLMIFNLVSRYFLEQTEEDDVSIRAPTSIKTLTIQKKAQQLSCFNIKNLKLFLVNLNKALKQVLINYKWSHINDLVFTLFTITWLGFCIQTHDYSVQQTSNILGIVFSYITIMPHLVYIFYSIYKIHKMVTMFKTNSKKFKQKSFATRSQFTHIFQSIINPNKLYKNYLHILRMLLLGFIVGIFSQSPGICIGLIAMQSLFYALFYLKVMPYADNKQNYLHCVSQFAVVLGLIFVIVINTKGESLSIDGNWALGWLAIVSFMIGVGSSFGQMIYNVLRGELKPKTLRADQQPEASLNKDLVPKRLIMQPKVEFEGWQYQKGLIDESSKKQQNNESEHSY